MFELSETNGFRFKIKVSIKKCLGEASFSLYYSVICGNCLGNVLVGTKNVEKCAGHSFLYTTYIDSNICHGISLKKPSGNVRTRTCVAGIRSQQKCYALDHHTSPKKGCIKSGVKQHCLFPFVQC